MPYVNALPEQDVTEPSLRKALDDVASREFQGPWLLGLIARVPEHGASLLRMLDVLNEGGQLPVSLKHLVGHLVADRVGNRYFEALHAKHLREVLGYDDDDLAVALDDYDDAARLSEKERMALRFTEQLILDSTKIDDGFYDEMKKVLSEPEIMELGTWVGVNYGLYLLIATLDVGPDLDG